MERELSDMTNQLFISEYNSRVEQDDKLIREQSASGQRKKAYHLLITALFSGLHTDF